MVASNLAGSGLPLLGLGKVFSLNNFGWYGGDIGKSCQAAVDAAVEAGVSEVRLPAGLLLSDRNIDILPSTGGPDPNQTGVSIRGSGSGQTRVHFHAGSEGFRFLGAASTGGNYINRPRLEGLAIRLSGGARGLVLYETLFGACYDVLVYGATQKAIDIDDGRNQIISQNLTMVNVTAALSPVGWHIGQLAEGTFVGCRSNQNFAKGWHIEGCNGLSFAGLHLQDQGIPFHVDPANFNSIRLSIAGEIYCECPTKNIIQIDRAPLGPGYIGSVHLSGGMTVQGGHDATGEVILASDCALNVSARIEAPGWATHVRSSGPLESCVLTGLASTPALYDIDPDSLSRFTHTSSDGVNIGGVRMRTRAGRLEASTDGVTWRRLALES